MHNLLFDASCAVVQNDANNKSQLMPDTELDALLHGYDDRFMSALPEGLPPEYSIGHTTPLEAGRKRPFKHAYGLSPRELAEAKSQIADLTARGMLSLVLLHTLLPSCLFRKRMAHRACVLIIVH